MKRLGPTTVGLAIAFLVDLLLHIFQPLGDDFSLVSNIITMFFSLLAVIFGAASCKLHGLSNIRGRIMIFLTAGIFFWFLGELSWSLYKIVLGVEAPVASIADVFWIAGYPLFILGILLVWNSTKIKRDYKRLIFNLMLSAIILVFFFYLSLPTLTAVDMPAVEKATTAGYIIGDAFLLIALITTMIHISGKELFKLWVTILAALLLIAVADVLYTLILSSYLSGHIIDVLWDLGYLILAVGFFNYNVKYRKLLEIAFKSPH
ncbi:MAG: hypothetical protein QW835_02485 [Candidatus Hadarchaeum sp.]|uniref:hypothetical protein n=1 Tax=Candidatus Hadarchaeum sp. TaxID=2883567 RepID=UPI00316F014B